MKQARTVGSPQGLPANMVGDQILQLLAKHWKRLLGGVCILFVLLFGYFLLHYRATVVNQSAYAALTKLWDAEGELMPQKNGLAKFLILIEEAIANNKNSGLGAFLLMEKANAYLQAQNYQEALPLMDEALQAMPAGFIKDLYVLKKLLVSVTAAEEDGKNAAFTELESFAIRSDTDAAVKKMALYFLHKRYWQQKDFERAIAFGKKFLEVAQSMAGGDSYQFSRLSEIVTANLALITP